MKQCNYTTTKYLYNGKYQYSIVLVSRYSFLFRSKKFDSLYKSAVWLTSDLSEACSLNEYLKTIDDYAIRVSTPYITIYVSNYSYIETIQNMFPMQVRRISTPKCNLESDQIYLPKMNYDYRITLRQITNLNYSSFVDWSISNTNVYISDTTKRKLSNPKLWDHSGSYVYVTGQRTLNFVKIFLAGAILNIKRIVR